MFRWISLISFATVLGGIVLHRLVFSSKGRAGLARFLFLEWNHTWLACFRKLVFLLGLLSFCVLLVTGFGRLLLGGRLQGYWVMIHAAFAPVFIACTAFIAVTEAAQYAFDKNDIETLQHRFCSRKEGCWITDSGVGAKTGFWVLLVLSLPLTLTVVVSMLPLYGPKCQDVMFALHRWCALGFSLVALLELYALIRMQIIKNIHGCSEQPKN